MSITSRAMLTDLAETPGKAELVGGRIIHSMPTRFRPSIVAARIYRSLHDHAAATGQGVAFTDNAGYAVLELTSGWESFSPDATFYLGPVPEDEMDFIPGPPTLAVEVRSKKDHGDFAEREMAAKRADYHEAGTPIVWDVDLEARVVRAYRADDPDRPTVFGTSQEAEAEPVLRDWRISVDAIFV